MTEKVYGEKPEIFLYKWRLVVNLITICIGIIVIIHTMFALYDINSLIIFRLCGALLILAGLWHIVFIKVVPVSCSLVSWVLTWFAYFMAYDDLGLRIWSYVFIGIGTFYLVCALSEFGNRQLEKEFGNKKSEFATKDLIGKSKREKSTIYITISSIFCVLLFIGILSYYILFSYQSIK